MSMIVKGATYQHRDGGLYVVVDVVTDTSNRCECLDIALEHEGDLCRRCDCQKYREIVRDSPLLPKFVLYWSLSKRRLWVRRLEEFMSPGRFELYNTVSDEEAKDKYKYEGPAQDAGGPL